MDLSKSLRARVEHGDRSHETLLALHEEFMGEGRSRDDALSLVVDLLLSGDLDAAAEQADLLALDVERTAGLGIPTVDEDGLHVNQAWSVYAPISGPIASSGRRDDVANGAVFLDLVSPSIISVETDGERARVLQGTVDLSELDSAKDPWDRFASACQHRVESANDDGRTEVSSFVVAVASTGILNLFEEYGEDAVMADIVRVVAPEAIWDELSKLGVGIRGRRGRCA
jgi:hypothetical protein